MTARIALLRGYRREWLAGDLIAGVTVAASAPRSGGSPRPPVSHVVARIRRPVTSLAMIRM
jgi:hypothetical protein